MYTDAPATGPSAKDAPVEDAPKDASKDALIEDVPATDALIEDAPATDALIEDAPAKDALIKDAPATDAPANYALSTDAPVQTPDAHAASGGALGVGELARTFRTAAGETSAARVPTSVLPQSSRSTSLAAGLEDARTAGRPIASRGPCGLGADEVPFSRSIEMPDAEMDLFPFQSPGRDLARQAYKWQDPATAADERGGLLRRSQSFTDAVSINSSADPSANSLSDHFLTTGVRRDYLLKRRHSQPSLRQSQLLRFTASNYINLLTLYGHFAGEDLEDFDEESRSSIRDREGDYEADGALDITDEDERRALLGRETERHPKADASLLKATLLLIKAFVGTGVLFLPRAFKNGGLLFSIVALSIVAAISLLCFIILLDTRATVHGSYGHLGEVIYGPRMRIAILTSIAVSQIGFVCAYMIFIAETLRALILAFSNSGWTVPITFLIVAQMIAFLPLAMIRNISKLSFTALVADLFILLGLVYLYQATISHIVDFGVADIKWFNSSDCTLFLGTAIFTFEGIGLIIPIQESMKEPEKFTKLLSITMVFFLTLFISVGALGYAAFGSKVQTVVILNLPQNGFVYGVQILYTLAIVLSTPLQLFPAIRILEGKLFQRSGSGKFNYRVKWRKNLFRFLMVCLTGLISIIGANDLDKFVALIGSCACIPLVYVSYRISKIPSMLIMLKIYPPLLHYKSTAKTRGWKFLDIVICVIGVFAMIYTSVMTLQSWASNANKSALGSDVLNTMS